MTPTSCSCLITDVRGDVHPAQLSETMVVLFNWMTEVARRGGMADPIILSGCRSPERQRFLQREWDEGRREGLAVRPSDTSKHLPDPFGFCRAFDLANTSNWLAVMGPVVAQKWPNIEWGGTFIPRDPRHFEER